MLRQTYYCCTLNGAIKQRCVEHHGSKDTEQLLLEQKILPGVSYHTDITIVCLKRSFRGKYKFFDNAARFEHRYTDNRCLLFF